MLLAAGFRMDGSDGEPDYRFDITHPERFGNFHIDSWRVGVEEQHTMAYKLLFVHLSSPKSKVTLLQHLKRG